MRRRYSTGFALPRAVRGRPLACRFTRSPRRPRFPTPESVFGFQAGADFKLANYEQVVTYFQRVDEASDRVMLVQAGRSTQGRPFYFALVSTPENLAAHRSLPGDRAAAGASRRPDGCGSPGARARGQGVRPHRRRPALHGSGRRRSTCRSSCYDIVSRATSNDPEIAAMLDNVDPDALADDQSRRPHDGRRLLHVAASARRTKRRACH